MAQRSSPPVAPPPAAAPVIEPIPRPEVHAASTAGKVLPPESTAPPAAALKQPAEASECESGVPTGDPAEGWHVRLRAARENAQLSRPAAAISLKKQGTQITVDAIKKHEQGDAMPRPGVRKAYAVIYNTSESALFS